MNIEVYISSGILETYVLGMATPEESAEVEANARQHPEIATEIEDIRLALESYALTFEKEPPAYLQEKIFQQIFETTENEPATEINLTRIPVQTEEPEHRQISFTPENKTVWFRPWMAAASVGLLFLSLGGNVWLFNSLQHTREQLASLESKNSEVSQVLSTSQQAYQEMKHENDMFQDPGMKMVRLLGTDKSPHAAAMIAWKMENKQVYVLSPKLPPPPDNMQYQLWAIVKGKPVSAGMLEKTGNIQLLSIIPEAEAFAITLEKKGGRPAPEGDMYVMGKV